ncbi:MAG: threonylcarbamoyl-AMP synthase [Candidatus Latescibacterota bacterium]|nr:MAG: threonylcarbamoyl-AMP synthase [Candidatus Latescibacterota bacterium]
MKNAKCKAPLRSFLSEDKSVVDSKIMAIDKGKAFERACEVLQGGGVIVVPTETVYGLGADAFNPSAVRRVYAIKGRDFAKPLSLLVSDERMLREVVAAVPDVAKTLMRRFWPGPLTLVFKASDAVPREALGGGETVAVRLSSSPVVRRLLDLYGRPLTATSANRSGCGSARSAQEAMAQVGEEVDLILDGGPSGNEAPSTVVDVSGGEARTLRQGGLQIGDW